MAKFPVLHKVDDEKNAMHLVFNKNSKLISDLFGLGAHHELLTTPSNQILVV